MTALVDPPSVIVQQVLTESQLASSSSSGGLWPIFVSLLPDTESVADNALAVYDTPARQDGRLMGTGERVEHHGFQVRVRATSYLIGYGKAREICNFLDQIASREVAIDNRIYNFVAVTRSSAIISLGIDKQERNEFTVNATCSIVSTNGEI